MAFMDLLLLLVSAVLQMPGTSAGDDFSCASGFVYKLQGPGLNCIKSCKYPNPNPVYCPGSVPGCYCPDDKPYEVCIVVVITTEKFWDIIL